jgi:DNA modification methylase
MQEKRRQAVLFETGESRRKKASSSTFSNNIGLPIHRWFRYSAGFSAIWVREVLESRVKQGRRNVLDPFVGSGTVLIEAERAGAKAIGIEPHPFVFRIAQAKLFWRSDAEEFSKSARDLLKSAQQKKADASHFPVLIRKCYPDDVLCRLAALQSAWADRADGSPGSTLLWLALVAILRQCSPVGTANWQYVLPKKSKASAADPFTAFSEKVSQMADDMTSAQQGTLGPKARLFTDDARELPSVPDAWADLVITSPPYPNNFDYADATRLEMSFIGDVSSWGDLQESVRKFLIRSCTQHVSGLVDTTFEILQDELLAPIADEITGVCKKLAVERETHGGKKNYHTMIAAYFSDMARVWRSLRRATKPGGLACFVIGDSAPYGIHVAAEEWLGKLAVAAGFRNYHFEKTRDRNIKWKNRKHRVPLHEGRLWVEG